MGEVCQFGILAATLLPPVHNCSLAKTPDRILSPDKTLSNIAVLGNSDLVFDHAAKILFASSKKGDLLSHDYYQTSGGQVQTSFSSLCF